MKILKKNIIGFIIGGIIFVGISYGVASQILATQVSYTNEKSVANVTSVDGALTELYGLAEECQNASSSGSAVTYYGKDAVAVYLDPTNLSTICSSAASSNTGTKEGCMRFWKYAEDGESYYAILDHNTTGVVTGGFYSAQSQVKEDTKTWNPNLQARNIRADEVYKITESTNNETNWQINGGNFFYFNKKNGSNGQGYGWFIDRTEGCKNTSGCTTPDNNLYSNNYNSGYWTSDVRNSSVAWHVYSTGQLYYSSFNQTYLGVRPVIKIR